MSTNILIRSSLLQQSGNLCIPIYKQVLLRQMIDEQKVNNGLFNTQWSIYYVYLTIKGNPTVGAEIKWTKLHS